MSKGMHAGVNDVIDSFQPGDTFRPPFGLASPHLQSLLNSSALRKRLAARRAVELLRAEQELVLDGGPDGSGRARLVGHWSPHPQSRGAVVLLHGWEGSSRSSYVLSAGARLWQEGYSVMRLNFRDHGATHHLNAGLFHSCRLDEVIAALGDMQQRFDLRGWQIAGYSLGGNFALRVALKGPARGLNIGSAFAVCPVVDPAHVLVAMESGLKFYERYYVKKWERSIRVKQASFPDRYRYEDWYLLPSLRSRTEYFATHDYEFESLAAYFDGYSIAGDRLTGLSVPATLLTAADDPVVPVADALALPRIPALEILVTRFGGHCGYLRNWRLDSWAEDLIVERFAREPVAESTSEEIEESGAGDGNRAPALTC